MVDIWLTPSPLLVNVVYECPLKERTKSIGVIHKPCGQKGEGFIKNSNPQNVKKTLSRQSRGLCTALRASKYNYTLPFCVCSIKNNLALPFKESTIF